MCSRSGCTGLQGLDFEGRWWAPGPGWDLPATPATHQRDTSGLIALFLLWTALILTRSQDIRQSGKTCRVFCSTKRQLIQRSDSRSDVNRVHCESFDRCTCSSILLKKEPANLWNSLIFRYRFFFIFWGQIQSKPPSVSARKMISTLNPTPWSSRSFSLRQWTLQVQKEGFFTKLSELNFISLISRVSNSWSVLRPSWRFLGDFSASNDAFKTRIEVQSGGGLDSARGRRG